VVARAQQGDRLRRIGVLMGGNENDPEPKARLSAFTQGLADLGWTDGRNVRMDLRWGGVISQTLTVDTFPPGRSLNLRYGVRLIIPDRASGSPVLPTLSLCTCCRHYPGALFARNPAVSAFPERVIAHKTQIIENRCESGMDISPTA
jgi:hypothetical protein